VSAFCAVNGIAGRLTDGLDPAKHKQVQRIVQVEAVFQNRIDFGILPPLSVIQLDNGD
jgi:hypothetical protein